MSDTKSSADKVFESAALALIEYVGPLDDPRIGWIGHNPSSPELFKCERCEQENIDSSKIEHKDGCSAARLINRLENINKWLKGEL